MGTKHLIAHITRAFTFGHISGGHIFILFALGVLGLALAAWLLLPPEERRRKIMQRIETWVSFSGIRQSRPHKVAEDTLGRHLKRHEIVHHINGVREDNRPENLCVMNWRDHKRYLRWYEAYLKKHGEVPPRDKHLRKLREDFNAQLLGETLLWKTGG